MAMSVSPGRNLWTPRSLAEIRPELRGALFTSPGDETDETGETGREGDVYRCFWFKMRNSWPDLAFCKLQLVMKPW